MRLFFNEEEVPEANYVSVIPEGKTLRFCFEGCATSHWGPHGVRGLKGTIPANGILLIGNSFTASQHLDDGSTYADVMQSELKKNGITNYVLNSGKSAVAVPH